ncbi:MAG: MoxR family ATPase [Anaerolineae bacterium]|nr:MAG: MoxR family ATPase [Anaerolineae bacterium]
MTFESIDDLQTSLRDQLYLTDRGLATAIFLALKLERPLFLEGEAGVGKTEVAKALAGSLDTELIRLQCYEGLDVHHAVYEWNYTRQMLHIRMLEARDERPEEQDLFGSQFLLRRPLLQAIEWEGDRAPVLLIDELDRGDEEFEAFLLEILSEFQVTIPEIGTIRAQRPPIAVITSNRTREVHDALKRRCLYHWIDYPSFEREFEILRLRLPKAPEQLSRQVTAFVQKVREADLYKVPGVAETLDWAEALWALDQEQLDPAIVDDTLGALLKYQDDVLKIQGAGARAILAEL